MGQVHVRLIRRHGDLAAPSRGMGGDHFRPGDASIGIPRIGLAAIWTPPTPEEQVQFLRNIQRLLAEGHFTTSYKFALLHALADLAVLKGDDSGAPLEIETREIAARFIELYWRQARPVAAAGEAEGPILLQSARKQAAIVARIERSRRECGGSLLRLKVLQPDHWSELVGEVNQVVRIMPLWKLQTIGDERLEFLYENRDRGSRVTLRPGVACCFRTFYQLIRSLIECAWLRYIQRVNGERANGVSDLGSFLFGKERTSLDAYRPILMDVQRGLCLYCQKPLSAQAQVDHFVPWSRYPADFGHNFILAHEKCNSSKSDHLAAENHLAVWIARNREHQPQLQERLVSAALPGDGTATTQIARWMYGQIDQANGRVWVIDKVLKRLDPDWANFFWAGGTQSPVPTESTYPE